MTVLPLIFSGRLGLDFNIYGQGHCVFIEFLGGSNFTFLFEPLSLFHRTVNKGCVVFLR